MQRTLRHIRTYVRFPSFRGAGPVGILVAWTVFAIPCWAQPERVNLVEDPSQWLMDIQRSTIRQLDLGAEATQFADPDFIRAIAYRKPCTDLPYNPRPEWEVPRHWLHAIHPGHGNDRKAMQGCVGLLRELIAAGWDPVPGARATPEPLRVERYGAGGRVYLVLHNPTPSGAQISRSLGVRLHLGP